MAYPIDFGEYFRYDALTAHLRGLAAAYPDLAVLELIGQTWRERDIWCMTLTNRATGPHDEKPAFYIDANIHAEEVTTSHTALYTIWYLLENYGTAPDVTWLLDHLTFYIIPRVNPDGAEISLTTGHHWCGNGRYLPGEEQTAGLCQHDINGDGLIVQMRIEDPAGEWKVSEDDPRLMVQRAPGEVGGGPYYRLYREGELRGAWDGVTIEIEKPRDGNLNRNYPAGWRPEFRQYGAGEYPLSEPEALATAQFIRDHAEYRRDAVLSHAWRCAPAPIAGRAGQRAAAFRSRAVQDSRRDGHRTHRVSSHFGLRGIHDRPRSAACRIVHAVVLR